MADVEVDGPGIEAFSTSPTEVAQLPGDAVRKIIQEIVQLWFKVRPWEPAALRAQILEDAAKSDGTMFTKTRSWYHLADIPAFIVARIELKLGRAWKHDASIRKILLEELPICKFPTKPKTFLTFPEVGTGAGNLPEAQLESKEPV